MWKFIFARSCQEYCLCLPSSPVCRLLLIVPTPSQFSTSPLSTPLSPHRRLPLVSVPPPLPNCFATRSRLWQSRERQRRGRSVRAHSRLNRGENVIDHLLCQSAILLSILERSNRRDRKGQQLGNYRVGAGANPLPASYTEEQIRYQLQLPPTDLGDETRWLGNRAGAGAWETEEVETATHPKKSCQLS
jgi:hypothetical protein